MERTCERCELIEGEDYYWEGPVMVFTARFHLKRGHCCGNRCRHCPYGNGPQSAACVQGESSRSANESG